jgi:hypothetical protein
MSLGRVLALGALTVALTAPVAQAQTLQPGGARLDRGRPVVVTPGRPTIVDRQPVRPRGERGDDDHLRERLRNACFNEPNPPSPLCRRVFGDHPGSRGQ